MKLYILIALAFSLASCAQAPPMSAPKQSYKEWRDSRKVDVFYERGYKDIYGFQEFRYPNAPGPIHHKPIKK